MKRLVLLVCVLGFFALVSAGIAAAPKQYQVTGPVVEVKDDYVVVQKGNEKWQIMRDKDTKVSGGELKQGAKVTVHYTMKAEKVEVKGEAAKGAEKGTPKKK